jgi:hypothetical protein
MRKRARTDLCGGRSVMVVPTATIKNASVNFLVADHPSRGEPGGHLREYRLGEIAAAALDGATLGG